MIFKVAGFCKNKFSQPFQEKIMLILEPLTRENVCKAKGNVICTIHFIPNKTNDKPKCLISNEIHLFLLQQKINF